MPETAPPPPGPAPRPFVFPFTEAQAAKEAVRALIHELEAIRSRHQAAVGPMRVDFEGSSREAFDRRFEDAMGDLGSVIDQLHDDVDELEADIARAHRRRDEYERELASWQRAERAYADYRAAHPDAVPTGFGGRGWA